MDNKRIESMFAKIGVNTVSVQSFDESKDTALILTTLVMYSKFGESQDDGKTPAIIPSARLIEKESDFSNNRIAVRFKLSELNEATPVARRSSGSVELAYTKSTTYDLNFTSSDGSKIVNNPVMCKWNADDSRGVITLENGVTFEVFSDAIDNYYVNETRSEREVYVCALSFEDSDDSLETSYGLTNLFKQLAKIDSPITGNASDKDSLIAESAQVNLTKRVQTLAVSSIDDESAKFVLDGLIADDSDLQAIATKAIASAQAESDDNEDSDS